MYELVPNMFPKNDPHVGLYSIHGANGTYAKLTKPIHNLYMIYDIYIYIYITEVKYGYCVYQLDTGLKSTTGVIFVDINGSGHHKAFEARS